MAVMAGVIAGGGAFFLYLLRAHTYLTDEPSACVNCHIMSPYYATWMHSSHSRDATCNDCHVPHENFIKKWTFRLIMQRGCIALIQGMQRVMTVMYHMRIFLRSGHLREWTE